MGLDWPRKIDQQSKQLQNIIRAVEDSPNSIIITSLDGVIQYVNPSFSEQTGYTAEEARGQKMSLLQSGETSNEFYAKMWQTILSGQVWKGELKNRRKTGESYWEETIISPIFDTQGEMTHFIAIKEDISARKEVQEVLNKRLGELVLINTISQAASSRLDLESLVSLIGEKLEETFNVKSVFIALHDQEKSLIETPFWTINRQRIKGEPLIFGQGLTSVVLLRKEPLLIDQDFADRAPKMGLNPAHVQQYGYPKTWLGVPIMVSGEAVGVISVQDYTREKAFSAEDVRLLTTIASNMGVALQNAKLYESVQKELAERKRAEQESRRRADEMTVLYHTARAITAGLDLETVLSALREQCQQVALVEVFSVATYHPETERMSFIKFYDRGKERTEQMRDVQKRGGVTGTVIAAKQTIYIADTNAPEAVRQFKMRHSSSEHARTYLGIPLFQGGQVTGVLSVQAYEPNAYSPEQIQFIETIASHASIAIENARLYEEARRRADEMTKLYEISTALSSDLELNAVLERIFEICRQILPMDSFYVAIYDASSGHILHPLFWDDGKFKPIAVRDIHQSPGLTGEVILSRQTLYLPDSLVEKVREKYQIIHSGGKPARTYVGVPMMAHGSVIGVLSMQSYQPDAYQTEQIQLLETIATQAAIAIENSRLYEQARSELIQRKEAQEALEQTNSELQNQLSKVEALQLELREQAIRDSLTGLFNRRYLDESLAKRIERASDHDQPLSVIMLDIDRFKNFNDQHGHQAGDTLLRVLGKTLRDHTRATDFACRYGGEEFLIVLPNAPIEIAARRAEEIRMAFENTKIPFSGRSLHSTISLGVASYPLHGLTGEELIVRADQAMYAAKAAGRNLVKVWQGAQPQA